MVEPDPLGWTCANRTNLWGFGDGCAQWQRVSFHFGEARFSSLLYTAIDPSIFFVNGLLAHFFLSWLVSLMGCHKVSHWWPFQQIMTKTHGGLGFNLFLQFWVHHILHVFLSFNSICLSQYCCWMMQENPCFSSSRYVELIDLLHGLKPPTAITSLRSRYSCFRLLMVHAMKVRILSYELW